MPDPLQENRTHELQSLVERDPATALYLPLAERLREEGRVEEAIRLCESRKNRPGRGVGDAIVLGRCYLADGRLSQARSAFEAALALDRENVAALKALAGILAHEGRHAAAVDLYRAVCRVDSGDLESQTALHQITSGEYAEVCPADVVVGQGDLGWRPVRLPREEENLSDLALGLRTIEEFDAAAPGPEVAKGRSLHELSLDELETGTLGAADAPPFAAANAPATAAEDAPGVPETFGMPLGLEDLEDALPESLAKQETPPAPLPPAPAVRSASDEATGESDPALGGNRSAFQDWVRRMSGGGA